MTPLTLKALEQRYKGTFSYSSEGEQGAYMNGYNDAYHTRNEELQAELTRLKKEVEELIKKLDNSGFYC